MAREKNLNRADARRRTRVALREARAAEDEDMASPEVADEEPVPTERQPFFRLPNVRDDIAAVPDLFRQKRLLWLPFALLIASFVVALGLPFNGMDPQLAQILAIFVQMVFLPQGLITFLIAGFIAPRAAYLFGFLVGVLNAVLLVAFAAVRSEDVLSGVDPQQAQVGLALMVGYALVIGPIAAAFAAWYRAFLNRMGQSGRERRMAREQELAKKRKEEARSARRPQRTT